MTNPNKYNYGPDRQKIWLKRAIGMGSVALAAVSFGLAFQHFNGAHAGALESGISAEATFDGAPGESSADTEESEQTEGGEVKNTPEAEYPKPTVEEARVTIEGPQSAPEDNLQSMEDVPDAFAQKLSEWLMAGATIDTYNEYLKFEGTIEDFTTQKAEGNAVVYQNALFGGENIASQESVNAVKLANSIALARFLTSVNNAEVSEAYEAKFVAVDKTVDEAYAVTEGDWTFRLETNGDRAINPDYTYNEPFGGNDAEVAITTDLWIINEAGKSVYGADQFGLDENGQNRNSVRLDRFSISSSQNSNT